MSSARCARRAPRARASPARRLRRRRRLSSPPDPPDPSPSDVSELPDDDEDELPREQRVRLGTRRRPAPNHTSSVLTFKEKKNQLFSLSFLMTTDIIFF